MKTQQLDLDAENNNNNEKNTEDLFPFENKFAKIEKLEEDVIRKICPLCGIIKDLEYAKTNSGYTQKVCEQCAVKYVKWWRDKLNE